MRYFRILTLLFIVFFIVACEQKPAADKPAAPKTFEQQPKTPLEEQINKITNTVLLEPLRALKDDSYFYREKQYLATALDNSTQKEFFFSFSFFLFILYIIL